MKTDYYKQPSLFISNLSAGMIDYFTNFIEKLPLLLMNMRSDLVVVWSCCPEVTQFIFYVNVYFPVSKLQLAKNAFVGRETIELNMWYA